MRGRKRKGRRKQSFREIWPVVYEAVCLGTERIFTEKGFSVRFPRYHAGISDSLCHVLSGNHGLWCDSAAGSDKEQRVYHTSSADPHFAVIHESETWWDTALCLQCGQGGAGCLFSAANDSGVSLFCLCVYLLSQEGCKSVFLLFLCVVRGLLSHPWSAGGFHYQGYHLCCTGHGLCGVCLGGGHLSGGSASWKRLVCGVYRADGAAVTVSQ